MDKLKREAEWTTDGPWCCEQHPNKPFPHDDCAGPGMPDTKSPKRIVEDSLEEEIRWRN